MKTAIDTKDIKILVGKSYLIKDELSVHEIKIAEIKECEGGEIYYVCTDGHSWTKDFFILSFTGYSLKVLLGYVKRRVDHITRQHYMEVEGKMTRVQNNCFSEDMYTYVDLDEQ